MVHTLGILTLRRLRQENRQDFEASLGFIAGPCLKKQKQKQKQTNQPNKEVGKQLVQL